MEKATALVLTFSFWGFSPTSVDDNDGRGVGAGRAEAVIKVGKGKGCPWTGHVLSVPEHFILQGCWSVRYLSKVPQIIPNKVPLYLTGHNLPKNEKIKCHRASNCISFCTVCHLKQCVGWLSSFCLRRVLNQYLHLGTILWCKAPSSLANDRKFL